MWNDKDAPPETRTMIRVAGPIEIEMMGADGRGGTPAVLELIAMKLDEMLRRIDRIDDELASDP
jgi:hypothetical protein